uniref:Uncharacterized protein n=1 Tax=Oryzias sinensis TaxID=183150 RepID=A0A8C8E180_9TELE
MDHSKTKKAQRKKDRTNNSCIFPPPSDLPSAELQCFTYVTNNKQFLKLSCSWDGGIPKALLWWEGPGGQNKSGEESSNILVLSFGTARNERAYTCYAQHPLLAQHKTCLVTLVSVSKPILTLRDFPVEGSTIRMICSVKNGTEPIQYMWQRQSLNGNFSTFSEGNQSFILMTYINRNHTGWYRCVVSNVVNTESSDPFWLDINFGPDNPQINISPNPMMDRIHTAVELESEYVTLETQAVSLMCQAQSNPPGQYIWFFNNSQIHNSSQLTIPKILRNHTGNYTCSAQNIHLNTSSSRTINLTVYYPPAGSPSCSMEPARNHSSLRLICSWSGGFPSPVLHWRGDLVQNLSDARQQTNLLSTSAILLPSGGKTLNTSLSTCVGSHPALKQLTECSTRTFIPSAEPQCFAQVTDNKKDLMLSCSWDGGAPKAFIWWEGPGGQNKGGEESSNVMFIRYDTAHFEKPYTCFAQHPLLLQPKTCRLTLEAPVLLTQRRVISVYEGTDVQLTCNLRANYLPVNEITWFNNRGADIRDTSKYMLLRTSAWANLTVRDTDETQDSGEYRCSTSNAVGAAEINVTLVVKKYPMPPNATLIRVMYNSRQRQQVEAEWQVESGENGGWTGFFLEYRKVSERPGKRGGSNSSQEQVQESAASQDWYRIIIQDPETRSHTVYGLIPTVTYQFRITAVNYNTFGHPSAVKIPGEQKHDVYPAVIGAAVGGMIFAAILMSLLLVYIVRNRNNNPRLHDMLFGSQHSQSRENINFPEDEVVGRSEGGKD